MISNYQNKTQKKNYMTDPTLFENEEEELYQVLRKSFLKKTNTKIDSDSAMYRARSGMLNTSEEKGISDYYNKQLYNWENQYKSHLNLSANNVKYNVSYATENEDNAPKSNAGEADKKDNGSIYESRRLLGTFAEMLSYMSESNDGRLDPNSYAFLCDYLDKNPLYDGVSGEETLKRLGITSGTATNMEFDPTELQSELWNRINSQKTELERMYEDVPLFAEARMEYELFANSVKNGLSAAKTTQLKNGMHVFSDFDSYQAASKIYTDSMIPKADKLYKNYDAIKQSIEANREKYGEAWAKWAISQLESIKSYYDAITSEAENVYDKFENEEQFYENYYSAIYSNYSQKELLDRENWLERRIDETNDADLRRELKWVKSHISEADRLLNMNDSQIEHYKNVRKAEYNELKNEQNFLNMSIRGLKGETEEERRFITEANSRLDEIDERMKELEKGILGYTNEGIAITFDGIYALRDYKEYMDKINSAPELSKAYEKALDLCDDYDALSNLNIETSMLAKKTNREGSIFENLGEEYQNQLLTLSEKYGFSPYSDSIADELWDLLEKVETELTDVKSILKSNGIDFDKCQEYQDMVDDLEAERATAEKEAGFAKEHPILATILSIGMTPLQVLDYTDNLRESIIGKFDKGSMKNVANVNDDGFVNLSNTLTTTVSGMIQDKVKESTGSDLLAGLAGVAYSGGTSVVQSAMLYATCKAVFGAGGDVVALWMMGSQAAAQSYNEAIRRGCSNSEAICFSIASGVSEALCEKIPFDEIFKVGKGADALQISDTIKSYLKKADSVILGAINEGNSELCTELSNYLADEIINGGNSSYNASLRSYMEGGYTYEQAQTKAAGDIINNFVGAWLGGAIGSGISSSMGLVTKPMSTIGNVNTTGSFNNIYLSDSAAMQNTFKKQVQNNSESAERTAKNGIGSLIEALDGAAQGSAEQSAVKKELVNWINTLNKSGVSVSKLFAEKTGNAFFDKLIEVNNTKNSDIIRKTYDSVVGDTKLRNKAIEMMKKAGNDPTNVSKEDIEMFKEQMTEIAESTKYKDLGRDRAYVAGSLEAAEHVDKNYVINLRIAEYLSKKEAKNVRLSAEDASDAGVFETEIYSDEHNETLTTQDEMTIDKSRKDDIIKETDAVDSEIVEVKISKSKYPQTAQHILDAIAAGHPEVLTIDREARDSNRREAQKGLEKSGELDWDEYPPAMFAEGGNGASVRAISIHDNRGAGASMGNQLRHYKNGTKVRIIIVE